MKITTKAIIKMLPFDEDFKNKLLNEWDTFDPDKKFNIEQVLWDTYDYFFEIKLKENTKLAFLNAEEGNEELDENFNKRIVDKTEKEMREEAQKNVEEKDLQSARKAMEIIVKEIRAAKKK